MPLPNLVILHGDDDFAIAERAAALKAEMGDPSLASLNTADLDGKSVTLSELREVCDALPFLTAQRLVIVRGLLTRLTGRAESEDDAPAGSSADFVDGLTAYFESFPDSAALVLIEPKAVNEKSRVIKSACKVPGAEIMRMDVPQGVELTKWIGRRAKAAGGEFTAAGAEALAAVGDEPRMLANEIEKLLAFVNWGRPVEPADVEKLTPAAGEAVIWDLVDALGARNAQQALNKFHTLLAMPSQDQFAIFGMIVRQFRLLLQTKEILENGGNVAEVMRALGLKGSFQAEKYARQCRNFSLAQLEAVYRKLLDLDLTLKTGGSDDTTAIDTFIAALASR
ncbi:MAG TPA: DNA polymerase III subunit delta [Anaerolineales bacterium]|nr:DNA polymerase III subunit delta [Anaerolineales bacterium]